MATRDDKADSPLPQTKTLTEQLSRLEDQMHNLLACYQYYGEAIITITDPDRLDGSKEWHLGLFLYQQWLRRQGEKVMVELVDIKRSLST